MKLSEMLKKAGAPQDQIDAAIAMEQEQEAQGKKIAELNSEARDYRKKASSASDELKKFEGIDLDEVNKLREEHLKNVGDFDKLKAELTESFAKKESEYLKSIDQLKQSLETVTIDKTLMAEASRLNAIDPHQVVSLLKGNIKLGEDHKITVMDGETIAHNSKGEPHTVESYVSDWLSKNPHHVKGSGGGSGSHGNMGGNASKQMARADFDKLPAYEQKGFIDSKGVVVD